MSRFAACLIAVAPFLCVSLEASAQQSADQLLLDYLVQSAADKQEEALRSYRKKDAKAAVTQFSDLIRTYRKMLEIKSLAEQGASHANYELMIAYGRLANSYDWLAQSGNRSKALQKAIEHSKAAGLKKPLTSETEVRRFISEIDQKL